MSRQRLTPQVHAQLLIDEYDGDCMAAMVGVVERYQEMHRKRDAAREQVRALTEALREGPHGSKTWMDVEFMDRLHRQIEEHGVTLDRLAADD